MTFGNSSIFITEEKTNRYGFYFTSAKASSLNETATQDFKLYFKSLQCFGYSEKKYFATDLTE